MGLSIKNDVTQFAPVPYRGQDRRKIAGVSPTSGERRFVVQSHPVMKEGDFHVKGVIESSSTQELSRENSPIDARVISVKRNIGGGIEYEFAITVVPGRRSASGGPPVGVRERRGVRREGPERRVKQVARPNEKDRRLAPFVYGKSLPGYSGAERRIHAGAAPDGKERRGSGLFPRDAYGEQHPQPSNAFEEHQRLVASQAKGPVA